jgi:hypothetical protein
MRVEALPDYDSDFIASAIVLGVLPASMILYLYLATTSGALVSMVLFFTFCASLVWWYATGYKALSRADDGYDTLPIRTLFYVIVPALGPFLYLAHYKDWVRTVRANFQNREADRPEMFPGDAYSPRDPIFEDGAGTRTIVGGVLWVVVLALGALNWGSSDPIAPLMLGICIVFAILAQIATVYDAIFLKSAFRKSSAIEPGWRWVAITLIPAFGTILYAVWRYRAFTQISRGSGQQQQGEWDAT